MKAFLIYAFGFVLALDVALQGLNLYRQGFFSSREIVSRASAGTTLDIVDQPISGHPDAGVVLVEFSDFECPFCRQYATGVYRELRERFVDSGKVRYAFVNTPLPIHPNAKALAVAATCAAAQNRFWEAHDMIFDKSPKTTDEIVLVAKALNLDTEAFERCIGDSGTLEKIDRGLAQAQRIGITGTPGFAIGTWTSSGRLAVHRFLKGAQPFNVFEQAILDVMKEHVKVSKLQS